ncbi:MAG TPA: acyltransferase [Ktedonobacterales bacterium]|nr:acyltransferase [Ktedonobacterales bacterium]
MAQSGVKRLGYVDGLRALAALEVVAFHIKLQIWWPRPVPQSVPGALVALFSYGHVAVSVFIVLSGFSLMLPIARNNNHNPWGVWGFYWRRARRILPPYYLALGFSLLLIWLFIGQPTGTTWDTNLPVTGQSVLAHLLLLQDFVTTDHASINNVFWSIAVECQIYVLFPMLVVFWRRYHPLFCALVVLTLSLILTYALIPTWIGHVSGYGFDAFAPQYIGLFAMGMFAASIVTHGGPRWSRIRAWYVWEILAIGCWVFVVLTIATISVPLVDVGAGAGTVGLLLAASRSGRINLVRSILEWRPLVWIGGFSYSLYLIHAPLIQLLWQYGLRPLGLGDTVTYLALLLVGLPLIVLAAWGFWWLCERPFLNVRFAPPQDAKRRIGAIGQRDQMETDIHAASRN